MSNYGIKKAAFLQEVQESIDAEYANVEESSGKKAEDTLGQLTSIQSFCLLFIKEASTKPPAEFETQKQGLDLLWQMFIRGAIHCDKDPAFHDRLLSLLLWTKELDSLCKAIRPDKGPITAWESYGFANSLQASWEQVVKTGIVTQQSNLAAFSAKALALGVYGEAIGLTALWYLREALETDDDYKTITLLPAAVIWMDHSRHKLFTFSVLNQSYEDQTNNSLQTPGALIKRENIDHPGFSLKRWLFWRRRFQKLSHHEDPRVAKEANKGFMCMINCGRDMDYEVLGEARFTERLQRAMGEELVRSGKPSVDGDEIDIDVHWVD
ncbi:hypothetical protein QQZ08_002992 [Neonectria magnoliae]|uniref:Uncharacterized protein n=1 Tax=Neonectria magnoliae TaxID=2732573 RepID=A0ABR1ICA4_9HYPO